MTGSIRPHSWELRGYQHLLLAFPSAGAREFFCACLRMRYLCMLAANTWPFIPSADTVRTPLPWQRTSPGLLPFSHVGRVKLIWIAVLSFKTRSARNSIPDRLIFSVFP